MATMSSEVFISENVADLPEDQQVNQKSAILERLREVLSSVTVDGYLTVKDLSQAMTSHKDFPYMLFELIDVCSTGSVSPSELIKAVTKLQKGSKKDFKRNKMKWFENKIWHVARNNNNSLKKDQFQELFEVDDFVVKFSELLLGGSSDKINVSDMLQSFQLVLSSDTEGDSLLWYERKFSAVMDGNKQVTFAEFKKALNITKSTFFAERFFQIFDTDHSGSVSVKELIDGLTIVIHGSQVDKLKFLFMVYDVDGNGYIDFEELKIVLKSCMDESALNLSDENLNQLTNTLFEAADADSSGEISFDELKQELERHPEIVNNLTVSAASWLQQNSQKRRCFEYIPHWIKWKYIRNNVPLIFCIVLWITVNVVLFFEAAIRHKDKGAFVSIARGCGQCLNFNPVVVLSLMMRKCMTWLRSSRISGLLPLDQYIELHKLTGYAIVSFSTLHFLAHLANFSSKEIQDIETNFTMWMYLFGVGTDLGWVGGMAGLTGFLLLIIIAIMFICALPFIRRSGHFQVFYWTHNLYIVWYIILILHGPNFWKWFAIPATIYIGEFILRLKIIRLVRYGKTYIEEGILLPSKVVHLVITRPGKFNFYPGDYVFIQIPKVAKYEWHPFTISSAPEKQGVFWLHICAVGTWTERLYKLFEAKNKRKSKGSVPLQLLTQPKIHHPVHNKVAPIAITATEDEEHPMAATDSHNGQNFGHMQYDPVVIQVQIDNENEEAIEVFFDGPYGSPSAHIFQAEHAVLIGAGIGVTPFASILQSIMIRYQNGRQVCPRCNHHWTGDIPPTIMTLKKVDFFWINRHQKYFEWFVSLLSQLEIEQMESGFNRFLDMHMYMTSALDKTDMKAIGLHMALDLLHKKEKRDLITGLKTRTQAGRPNWEEVFATINCERKGKVTVFYCGLPSLGKILQKYCVKYGFGFRKENF